MMDPYPVKVNGVAPMLCECGLCGRVVPNCGPAKRQHVRGGCFVDGVQVHYWRAHDAAPPNHVMPRPRPDFRVIGEEDQAALRLPSVKIGVRT